MNFLIYKTLLMFFVCAPICGRVKIALLPNQGSEVRLMCMLVKLWYHWWSKRCSHPVRFYVNGELKTSIPYKNCQEKNNDDYSYSCSGCRRILTIKNINNNNDSNSTWHCVGDGDKSREVFIPASVAPPCNVNTKIDYDVPVNILSLDGSLTLVEGDSLRLNCSSQAKRENNGANPNFQYSWTIDNQATRKGEIEGNSTAIVKLGIFVKHNISRFDAGTYVCLSTFNSTCKSSDTANLNVLYPPSVNITTTMSEDGEVNISCLIIPGNPLNTTRQGWRHVVDGQVVEEHPVEVDDNFTIYLPRPSVFDDGEYVCYATNGVRDVRGSVNQTKSTVIQTKVAVATVTIFNTNSLIFTDGQTSLITCKTGVSYPPASITWSIGGNNINGGTTTNNTDGTTTSILQYTPDKNDHNKTLQCSATNGYGSTKSDSITLNIRYGPSSNGGMIAGIVIAVVVVVAIIVVLTIFILRKHRQEVEDLSPTYSNSSSSTTNSYQLPSPSTNPDPPSPSTNPDLSASLTYTSLSRERGTNEEHNYQDLKQYENLQNVSL